MNRAVNNIPEEHYQQIKKEITSKDSVVGIDAVHTHILIINRLMELEAKLNTISKQLERIQSSRKISYET